jgi:peptidoglycan hydrolase-like protein with peptidoglycan-binding domain
LELPVLIDRSVPAAIMRCAAVLLACIALAATVAQAQQGEFPWNTPDTPKKKAPAAKPKPTQAKEGTSSGSVDSQADLAFWNSVKDRGKPDELRAYLEQFPQGRFAALARLRLKEAESGQNSAASGADTGASANASGVMREVQDRLYKLNYPIIRFDGGLDDGTDRAIKAWQTKHNFAPSGVLTAEQLKVLRSLVPARNWGAVAHPVIGAAVLVHSKASRQEAESAALADCKAKNGVACKVQAAGEAECIVVARYNGKAPDGRAFVSHFYSRQASLPVAMQKVIQHCSTNPQRGGSACAMVGAACGTSVMSAEQLNKALPADPARKQPTQEPKSKGQET